MGRYVEAGIVTVVFVPVDTTQSTNRQRTGYQHRDENDFLYRSQHASEWVSSIVDYDEYFAPTHPDRNRYNGPARSFVVEDSRAVDVDFGDASAGALFFPIHRWVLCAAVRCFACLPAGNDC